MCIAIYKKPELTIAEDTLEICAANNTDGCGFAYIKDQKVILHKCLDFKSHIVALRKAFKEAPESPFLIHYRIATHGDVNEFNCHPFWTREGKMVMMHNGTILNSTPKLNDKEELRSDTQIFNDTILKLLPKSHSKSKGIKSLVENYIGRSKVVTMDYKGLITIYNEQFGNWKEGIWYSNYSYNKNTRSTATKPWAPAENNYQNSLWDEDNYYSDFYNKSSKDNVRALPATTKVERGIYAYKGTADPDSKIGLSSIVPNSAFSRARFKYIDGNTCRYDYSLGYYRICEPQGQFINTAAEDARIAAASAVVVVISSEPKPNLHPCTWCGNEHKIKTLIHVVFGATLIEPESHDVLCTGCLRFIQESAHEPTWKALPFALNTTKQKIIKENTEMLEQTLNRRA